MERWLASVGAAVLAASLLGACTKSTYDVDVELWHCGVSPLKVDGHTWEVRRPAPFDGTNAPPSFTGHGTATVNDDKLVYVDDGGARIVFRPGEDVPPPPPCG
ncbi:hypothetical protein [Actinopolymorpha singaporensis]|uniref:hypothetical protein n=1 Tax=Actinopolymorpha singaporensis TaxID=117157 RepID=UPI0012FD905C|nr:hypothetical protein [Actinopolymorpha singaporensis]